MLLTYRYRVKGTSAAKRLARMAIAVNQVFNYCGGVQNESRRRGDKWPSWIDLINLTSGSSKELGLHSDTVQAVCKQFAASRDKAKKRPRWRVSFGAKRSLGWVPIQAGKNIRIVDDTIIFLKAKYRLWLSRPIPGKVRMGSFSQDAEGNWYVNLVCEVASDLPAGLGEVGIDLGLKDFTALSTGEKIANPRHLRKSAIKLAKAQRKGRKREARKIHRKVAAQRRDFLHKLSTRLARKNALVCVGDVSSSKLAKTRLAKSVMDAGWGSFREMLRYKVAMRHGARFQEVNERYSTQTCSACGSREGSPRGTQGLSVRSWECGGCGVSHDRDTNAAVNILNWGRGIGLPA